MIERTAIKNILVVSLSNIGDVLLTFPVIDILARDFPAAELSVVVGPKAEGLLRGNSRIKKLFVYKKKQPFKKTLRWFFSLRQESFDLIVDLRNSALPFLLHARYRTVPVFSRRKGEHMRLRHLSRLRSVYDYNAEPSSPGSTLYVSAQDEGFVDELLRGKLAQGERFAVVSPGAADHKKRWSVKGFAEVVDRMYEQRGLKSVFVGDKKDRAVVREIFALLRVPAIDLSGQTTLLQSAAVLRRAELAVTNDSSPLHLASYLGVPLVALFGPTDPDKYGPWGAKGVVLEKKSLCPACQGKKGEKHSCLDLINVDDVAKALDALGVECAK